jgi:hypothetical protein
MSKVKELCVDVLSNKTKQHIGEGKKLEGKGK